MNLPIENRLIDRLVDGELPDAERRELLLRFEKEPDGWRRCALAFLEAQTWRKAITSVVAPVGVACPEFSKGVSSGVSTPFASGSGPVTRSWRSVGRLSGLAAGLAAAFALGWIFHNAPEVPVSDVSGTGHQAESIADRSIQSSAEATVKLARELSNSIKPREVAAEVDPLAKNLEQLRQKGYRVETQQRLVSMESKDGRKLKLPVQEVRIRYIGDRIY